jgi:hypothetical protein
MNKLILTFVILVVSVAPSLADRAKPHGKTHHAGVERSWQRDSAQKTDSKDDYVDPYWQPCDYNTNWGPNACGGGD